MEGRAGILRMEVENIEKKIITEGGFIGLLALLISVAVIALIVVRTDLFSGKDGDKSMLEQGTDAVNRANEVKNLIEGRNQ